MEVIVENTHNNNNNAEKRSELHVEPGMNHVPREAKTEKSNIKKKH